MSKNIIRHRTYHRVQNKPMAIQYNFAFTVFLEDLGQILDENFAVARFWKICEKGLVT